MNLHTLQVRTNKTNKQTKGHHDQKTVFPETQAVVLNYTISRVLQIQSCMHALQRKP